MPQALFRPAAVVNGVIRLHAGDNPQLTEAPEVLRGRVLSVLNSKVLCWRILAPQALIHIEDFSDGAVANGVNADLKLRLVSTPRQGFQLGRWIHQREG